MIDNYSLERRTALYENNRYMNNDRSSRERPNQAYQEVMASEMDFQKDNTLSQSYNEEDFGNSTRSPIKPQQEIKTTKKTSEVKISDTRGRSMRKREISKEVPRMSGNKARETPYSRVSDSAVKPREVPINRTIDTSTKVRHTGAHSRIIDSVLHEERDKPTAIKTKVPRKSSVSKERACKRTTEVKRSSSNIKQHENKRSTEKKTRKDFSKTDAAYIKSEKKNTTTISIEDGAFYQNQNEPQTAKMISNMKDMLLDSKILEEKRKNLSLRPDFNVQELFGMVNYNKNGFLSVVEFEIWSNKNPYLNLNLSDIELIFERYDRDKDGVLSFHEFMQVFTPKTREYKRNLINRAEKGNELFTDLTITTQKMVKDLFKTLIYIGINMEFNKQGISDGKWSKSDELFRYMDKFKDGFVTYDEFQQTLRDNGMLLNKTDMHELFEEFDKNLDGRITFDEFHSPQKRDRDALVEED